MTEAPGRNLDAISAELQSTAEVEQLLAEQKRLQQRVSDLELTVAEYRRQMTRILGSTSWRLTSPLRVLGSRSRIVRLRFVRMIKGFRKRAGSAPRLKLSGLFPPPLSELPESSPLRRSPSQALPYGGRGAIIKTPDVSLPRILVLAHVHYPELWADIEDRLARIHEPFDLIVTVTQGAAESAIPQIARRHSTARIELVPNRGRDWAPLIHVVNKGLLHGYAAIAKVHTKKSEHRLDGDNWRLELLDGILESPDAITRIVDLLEADPAAGIVLPTGHISGPDHWGSNQGIVAMLASRLPMAFDPDALEFPAGSMFWCRPWLLERLADLELTDDDFEIEGGQYDSTTAHALERLVGVMATVGGMDLVETMDVHGRLRDVRRHHTTAPRTFAFYLPQFYTNDDNNQFWGEGFTDWVNVRKAEPLFAGHRQPIVPPSEVGYYDLADPETLRRQAREMRRIGVDGMIFHHYWFDGRQLLRTPLENLLADPSIPMPFALSWANEPWTRRWDGLQNDVLIPLDFSEGWKRRFYEDIRPALFDPRYITILGRPLLMIYRLDLLPDVRSAVCAWRHLAAQDGHEGLHVLGVLPSRDFGQVSPADYAELDGLVTFPPGSGVTLNSIANFIPASPKGFTGDVFSYDAAADSPAVLAPSGVSVPVYAGVFPGWDNTARRGLDAYVFHGANQLAFRRWLQRANTVNADKETNLVFINAWNEWAEGANIEGGALPDVYPTRSRGTRGLQ